MVAIHFKEGMLMIVSIESNERRAKMSVFEALSLMIAFATLVLMIRDDNEKK
ncbi:putative holin-like toxin [Enterococcus faecium]|nr:putative holin-like toxin [Enterococcus faecium]